MFPLFILCCFTNVPQIQSVNVNPIPETIHANMVHNFSFEDVQNNVPLGWRWDQRNTDGKLMIDDQHYHTGKRSIKLQNNTSYGSHVYASLWTEPAIQVKPKTRYTLSFYAMSDSPGIAWIGGGKNWQVRIGIQPTSGVWRRFSTEFVTADDETSFTLRINSDSPTTGFWVDDIKLEEGAPATFCEPPSNHQQLFIASPDWKTTMPDGRWERSFDIYASKANTIQIRVTLTQGEKSSIYRTDATLEFGLSQILINGEAIEPNDTICALSVQVFDPTNLSQPLAEASTQLRFLSVTNAKKRLDVLSAEAQQLNQLIEQAKQKGIDPAYPLVGATIVSDFIQYVQADLDHGEIEHVFDQLDQLESIAKNTNQELESAIAGKIILQPVPRYITSPITIDGPSFFADTQFPISGVKQRLPVIFTGYGHFAQVFHDLEKFNGYGANIIQIELGPNSVFPKDGETSDAVIQSYIREFDRAEKAGIQVCLLISPHYMPKWMLEKYPQLKIKREGFLQYCLHAPEGQELLKSYLRYLIPRIMNHPALHSICLANEPINVESPECPYAQGLWHEWLKERHGDIATLNSLWNSQYKAFDEITLPASYAEPNAHIYEFVLFNQEWFADWHRMLADTIHGIAPKIPIHTKAMTWNFFSEQEKHFGVDAELLAGFSQINGNDSVNFYNHGLQEWSQGWQLNNMGYDLQRSVGDMPIFNTENHIIMDRETRSIPSGHVRTVLWQSAIHGQSATTIWVWARTYDTKSDFAGSIMHRPECVEAVGHTGLDLLRLSEEVRALQTLSPQIGILYSTTSMVYDGVEYTDCLGKIYQALSFTGLKIGFVTERQLMSGTGNRPSVLIVPNIHHLPESAFKALAKYPGRIVLVGEKPMLNYDAYHNPRSQSLDYEFIEFFRLKTDVKALLELLLNRLPLWGLAPLVSVTHSDGSPVWGVEWLVAEYREQLIVNLIQHGIHSDQVVLRYKGKPFRAINLFNQNEIDGELTLEPLSPIILIGK
jgi:hypothetical protein